MSIRNQVLEEMRTFADSVVPMSGRSANYKINGDSVVNIRTATEKAGDKYWFDVTPSLYENNTVDFLLYACGSAENVYIFPTEDFKELIEGASLGGQKQVPNFTIYLHDHDFEPAGKAYEDKPINQYYNRWKILL